MSNIAWLPDERLAAYHMLAKAGFTGLEIAPALLFHAADDPFEPSPVVAKQALAELDDAGLTLVSMQSLLFGVSGAALFEGAAARAALETGMQRAIALAGRFDIPNLVFGSPQQRRIPDAMAHEQAIDEAVAVFRRLGDAATDAGTKIAIEANPAAYGTNFLTTLEEATDFVSQVNHPAIVPILDIGAMHMNNSLDEVPAYLPRLMPQLNHVHISEPQLAPAPRDVADMLPVLKALKAAGYDKAISIEMKRSGKGLQDVKAAIDRLVQAIRAGELADA